MPRREEKGFISFGLDGVLIFLLVVGVRHGVCCGRFGTLPLLYNVPVLRRRGIVRIVF